LNTIDGLMLDTTWHVLTQYVTSLLMLVYEKVAAPLGFAFGVSARLRGEEHAKVAFWSNIATRLLFDAIKLIE
jgi:hypothetical protein